VKAVLEVLSKPVMVSAAMNFRGGDRFRASSNFPTAQLSHGAAAAPQQFLAGAHEPSLKQA